MPTGKCPKCDTVIPNVIIEPIEVHEKINQLNRGGVSYLCPSCNTILGISIDPILLSNELLNIMRNELSKLSQKTDA
jgi:hypothetical protein